ncbi:CDGSH iron-sulfur domain-containing protein, putative [Hepatocystis sp. ex Piliocolobus tephrosceles]|nr:CDGSH iron-sulfur domain-containing protein, putative [Hepatocystis sp. ex Piliocolobus tephrosceles]
MKDPLEYINKINFNTNRFPQYNHLVENSPSNQDKDKTIKICRCWQSQKFPYCDDTHKVLMENGDSVGPFIAKVVSYKVSDEEKLKKIKFNEKYIKVNKPTQLRVNPFLNMKHNYISFTNNKTNIISKFKKSLCFSLLVLSCAFLYNKKEKPISYYYQN